MLKEGMDLDKLVEVHTKKRVQVKHYSRQLTILLAIVCLVFFGTILTYHTGSATLNQITGMASYVGNSELAGDLGEGMTSATGFVTAVKTSPDVTKYKLFFYTMWILVVLVGTAVYYEFDKR